MFQNNFCFLCFHKLQVHSSPPHLPSQLTVEKLCKLKPLHSGLSPAVLKDLHWSEISGEALCQCWRTLLTDLKPGHRSWLYDAVQEVMPAVFCTSHNRFLGLFLPSHPSTLYRYLPFLLAYNLQILTMVNAKTLPLSWLDVDIPVVSQQVLHRNLQNITQELTCLLPFVPLKTLTDLLSGETILSNLRWYRDTLWSPQQVCILYVNLCLPVVWSGVHLKTDGALLCGEETDNSFSFHSH